MDGLPKLTPDEIVHIMRRAKQAGLDSVNATGYVYISVCEDLEKNILVLADGEELNEVFPISLASQYVHVHDCDDDLIVAVHVDTFSRPVELNVSEEAVITINLTFDNDQVWLHAKCIKTAQSLVE